MEVFEVVEFIYEFKNTILTLRNLNFTRKHLRDFDQNPLESTKHRIKSFTPPNTPGMIKSFTTLSRHVNNGSTRK